MDKKRVMCLGLILLVLPLFGNAEGTSMGKPFDELWSAVTNLQQQIDVLSDQDKDFVSTEEHDADISSLQNQFNVFTGRYETDMTGLQGQINSINAHHEADVSILQGQIDNLNARCGNDTANLQGQIDALVGRHTTDISGLQGQIDAINSRIDEMQATETLTCGIGACTNTVPKYVNRVLQTCTPKFATFELCDGLDNDCDGQSDEDYPQLGHTCFYSTSHTGTYICAPSGMSLLCSY